MTSSILSVLCGLGGMFGWGIYDFFAGVYAKKFGAFKTFFWSQSAGFVFVLLLVPVFSITLDLSLLTLLLLPVAALFYSAGYLFFMKGFEKGNMSLVAAVMNLWAVFTMLIAFIFMGQRLSLVQTIGVFMIISGATLASLNWNDIKNRNFRLSSGVKETVCGAFFFGSFWNISEIISERIGWLLTTLFVKILSKEKPPFSPGYDSVGVFMGKIFIYAAPTIFEAGIKENVLPTKARAVVNFRILNGNSISGVIDHVRRTVDDFRVQVKPIGKIQSEPSPVSDIHSPGFDILQRTIRQVFPEVIVAPGTVIGATDSRHYVNLSRNIYRFRINTKQKLENVYCDNENRRFRSGKNRYCRPGFRHGYQRLARPG